MGAWRETSDAIGVIPSLFGSGAESMRSFTRLALVLGFAIGGGSCIIHGRHLEGHGAERQPGRPSGTEDSGSSAARGRELGEQHKTASQPDPLPRNPDQPGGAG